MPKLFQFRKYFLKQYYIDSQKFITWQENDVQDFNLKVLIKKNTTAIVKKFEIGYLMKKMFLNKIELS